MSVSKEPVRRSDSDDLRYGMFSIVHLAVVMLLSCLAMLVLHFSICHATAESAAASKEKASSHTSIGLVSIEDRPMHLQKIHSASISSKLFAATSVTLVSLTLLLYRYEARELANVGLPNSS